MTEHCPTPRKPDGHDQVRGYIHRNWPLVREDREVLKQVHLIISQSTDCTQKCTDESTAIHLDYLQEKEIEEIRNIIDRSFANTNVRVSGNGSV